jgi:hypothetical protein
MRNCTAICPLFTRWLKNVSLTVKLALLLGVQQKH